MKTLRTTLLAAGLAFSATPAEQCPRLPAQQPRRRDVLVRWHVDHDHQPGPRVSRRPDPRCRLGRQRHRPAHQPFLKSLERLGKISPLPLAGEGGARFAKRSGRVRARGLQASVRLSRRRRRQPIPRRLRHERVDARLLPPFESADRPVPVHLSPLAPSLAGRSDPCLLSQTSAGWSMSPRPTICRGSGALRRSGPWERRND